VTTGTTNHRALYLEAENKNTWLLISNCVKTHEFGTFLKYVKYVKCVELLVGTKKLTVTRKSKF